jgi:hypothetical protein
MSKRKPARARKARSTSKIRSKAARSGTAGHHQTRANSKQARLLALLRGPNGATIATVMRSTGWQPHTVRGFLAAVVRKKLGLRLESEKTEGEHAYRIVAGKNSADAAGVPSALACGSTGPTRRRSKPRLSASGHFHLMPFGGVGRLMYATYYNELDSSVAQQGRSEPSRDPATGVHSYLRPSSADFITIIAESNFRYRQFRKPRPDILFRCWSIATEMHFLGS